MRAKIILCLLCCVILVGSNTFAWSVDINAPSSSVQNMKIGHSTDGVGIMMGAYSPFHSEMKGIYGGAFMLSGQYCLNMSRSIDLLMSIGFIRKEGNPYYEDSTFTSGDRSNIRIIPMEVNIRKRFVLMREPARGLFVGAGINYISANEKVPDIISASGGDFGSHIFAGPQIFIMDNVAFEGEVKLLMNEIDMKDGSLRYPLTLSGLTIKAGLSWYY